MTSQDASPERSAFNQTFVRPPRKISAEGCTGNRKCAFHLAFVRPTRIISAEGCPSPRQIRISPQFVRPMRAISARGHVSMVTAGLPLPPTENI